MRFRLITAIWDEWYHTALLNTNLPILFAPRNLPALAGSHDISFKIDSSKVDAPIIAADDAYRRVTAVAPSCIVELSEQTLSSGNAASQPVLRTALDAPENTNVLLALMAPNMVWVDGTMEWLVGCFAGGKHIMLMTVLRVIDDTFLPAIWQIKVLYRENSAISKSP